MMSLSYGDVHFKIKVCLHISSRLKTQWSSSTEPHGLRSQWIFWAIATPSQDVYSELTLLFGDGLASISHSLILIVCSVDDIK